MSRNDQTAPAWSVSEGTRIKLPLAVLVAILSAVAAAAIAYGSVRNTIADHGEKISALEQRATADREMLFRIDENVKRLVRQAERDRQ